MPLLLTKDPYFGSCVKFWRLRFPFRSTPCPCCAPLLPHLPYASQLYLLCFSLIQMPHSSTASIAAWPFYSAMVSLTETEHMLDTLAGRVDALSDLNAHSFKLQHWLSQNSASLSLCLLLPQQQRGESLPLHPVQRC